MRSAALFVLASAASVLAQEVGNYTSSLNMTIDPGTVIQDTRNGWCDAQYNTCRSLCDDNTGSNNCNPSDLSWTCTCASNSSTPGLEWYSQTMPFFICKELFAQCQASTDSRSIQDECEEKIDSKCYENPPPKASASDDDDEDDDDETSTTAEATTSTTTSGNSDATSDDVTTTDTEDIAAPTLMPGNGVAAVAAIGVLAYML